MWDDGTVTPSPQSCPKSCESILAPRRGSRSIRTWHSVTRLITVSATIQLQILLNACGEATGGLGEGDASLLIGPP